MKTTSRREVIFVSTFLLLLFVPGILSIAGIDFGPTVAENRTKTTLPSFSMANVSAISKSFESFYAERIGLRYFLLTANKLVRFFVFGTPGSPKVLPGEDGWLFYRERSNLHDFLHTKLFSEMELERLRRAFQMRSDFAKRHGAHYLLVLAPDKNSIYPEKLPGWMPAPSGYSKTDQVIKHLREVTDVDVLDLRPALQSVKDQPIFHHTDTHWTDIGGYYAYRAMLEEFRRILPQYADKFMAQPLDNFEVKPLQAYGDLVLLLGLHGIITEDSVALIPKKTWQANVKPMKKSSEFHFVTENPHLSKAPRLLIFRDSFLLTVQGLLAEHFESVRFRWSYSFDRKLVLEDKPDLVVQFMVERALSDMETRAFAKD